MNELFVSFQWWLFILATCLNLLIQATRAISNRIDFAVRLCACESARYNQLIDRSAWQSGGEKSASLTSDTASPAKTSTPAQDSSNVPVAVGKAIDAAEAREHRDLTETPPFGAVVGFIER